MNENRPWRQMDKGLEALQLFLKKNEELLFNYEIHPDDGYPPVEEFIKQYEGTFFNMRIIENAAFHADGHLMENSVAVVGKLKSDPE